MVEKTDEDIRVILEKMQELFGNLSDPDHEPRTFEYQIKMASRVLESTNTEKQQETNNDENQEGKQEESNDKREENDQGG